MSIDVGNSFRSARLTDLGTAPYTQWGVPFEVLDTDLAPLDKQIRVAVGQTEYLWDDPDLATPPANRWTWEAGQPAVGGAVCWGIRLEDIQSVSSDPSDFPETSGITLWDGNGEVIDIPPGFMPDRPGTTGFPDRLWDNDPSTRFGWASPSGFQSRVDFVTPLVISKIGWTRSGDDNSQNISAMRVLFNLGTPGVPRWVQIAYPTGLTTADYPTISTPFNPETDTIQFEVPAGEFGGDTGPTLTLTPAPDSLNDRVTIWRETRQDRPWVQPTGAGRVYGARLVEFFRQRLFIYQELCALETIAPLVGLPPADTFQNDWSAGNQISPNSTVVSGDAVIDYSSIELLEGIPGAPSDPDQQLVVEERTGTNPETWAVRVSSSYTIDTAAKTITVSGETGVHRARRVTRKDRLWPDIDTRGPVGWGTAVISLIQRQLRFLQEEACIPPNLYAGHMLNTTIFPRAWNYLNFETGGTDFTFGGPGWGPDGTIVVYENDVLLTEGTDYEVNFPVITIPGGTNNPVTIGGGGGGFGGVNIPGTDPDDQPDGPIVNDNGEQETPDWPGLDLSTPFTITIGSVPFTDVRDGDWEGGGTFTQGVDGTAQMIRVFIEATEDFGAYDLGDKEVLYFGTFKCSNGFRAFLHASAFQANTATTWGNVVAVDSNPGACVVRPNGGFNLGGGQMFLAAMNQVSTPAANPLLQFGLGLSNVPIPPDGSQNTLDAVPFFDAWSELAADSVAAQENGVVTDVGFTSEQFENYIDPDVDFDDFDIPIP